MVHSTLKEMGLDMVDKDDNLPNSFFRIFTWSDPDLHLLEPEEQVAHLHQKLVNYISDNGIGKGQMIQATLYGKNVLSLG